MNLVYASFGSLLILFAIFLWYLYESRQVALSRRSDYDVAGWLLVSLLLVAALDFILLMIFLSSKP